MKKSIIPLAETAECGITERELPIEHHPVYFQMQEEYEAWTRKIEDLYPQQAYVKHTRNTPPILRKFFKPFKTRKIRTVKVPKPQCTLDDLQEVKEYYAQTLMKTKGGYRALLCSGI
jgi:hypothetical protein